MATYYVRKTGNNSSAGTSAGTAWLTLAKALGASGIASGDTVYVGAGTYRESVTVAMTSATGTTNIIADTDGAQTGDAGDVIWTAYTTNDKTSPTTYPLILSGRDYLIFQKFTMVGGSSGCVDATSNTSTNCQFKDCVFISGAGGGDDNLITWANASGVAAAWIVERCVFVGQKDKFIFINAASPSGSSGSDYDVDFVIRNCLFAGGGDTSYGIIEVQGSGGFGNPSGVKVYNCSAFMGTGAFVKVTSSWSTSTPVRVTNCLISGGSLNAASSGQLTENYNLIIHSTPRSNVSSGANSQSGAAYAMLINAGQEHLQGFLPRPFGTPLISSPLLGFGNDGTNTSSEDLLARPRPSGGAVTWATANKGIGCLERHDFGIREASTVDSGTYSIKVTGPGDLDFRVPVNAVSTTISVKVRWSSGYGAGTKPQVILLPNAAIGVATETVTATGSADTWNTITLSAFTPTATGWVVLRLNSQADDDGIAYWDTMATA